MKIVKHNSFRSTGTNINKTDDMERVVIDCTRSEFVALKNFVVQKPAYNTQRECNATTSGLLPIASNGR